MGGIGNIVPPTEFCRQTGRGREVKIASCDPATRSSTQLSPVSVFYAIWTGKFVRKNPAAFAHRSDVGTVGGRSAGRSPGRAAGPPQPGKGEPLPRVMQDLRIEQPLADISLVAGQRRAEPIVRRLILLTAAASRKEAIRMHRRHFLVGNFLLGLWRLGRQRLPQQAIRPVRNPGEADMVGSHTAGAETFKPLVEEAVSKLLARHDADRDAGRHAAAAAACGFALSASRTRAPRKSATSKTRSTRSSI